MVKHSLLLFFKIMWNLSCFVSCREGHNNLIDIILQLSFIQQIIQRAYYKIYYFIFQKNPSQKNLNTTLWCLYFDLLLNFYYEGSTKYKIDILLYNNLRMVFLLLLLFVLSLKRIYLCIIIQLHMIQISSVHPVS